MEENNEFLTVTDSFNNFQSRMEKTGINKDARDLMDIAYMAGMSAMVALIATTKSIDFVKIGNEIEKIHESMK